MLEILYKIIYHKNINYLLRNINFSLKNIFFNIIKIPPSGILNLTTESGKIKIATNQTSYLTQLLFWDGYKMFEYSKIFEEISKEISVFLDIGANIGYYSLLSTKSNPNIRVYAFEPAHGPKHFLNQNIKLNHFSNNIKPVDLALSKAVGKIDFYEVKSLKYKYINYNLAGEGNAGTKTTSRNFIKNTVSSTTLNDFIINNNLDKIDLIKIDTEGTEVEILKSGKSFIIEFQPIVICETLFNTIEKGLEDFFNDLDYEFYNHKENRLEKVSTIQRSEDDGIRNCFFIPKSKLNIIKKYID